MRTLIKHGIKWNKNLNFVSFNSVLILMVLFSKTIRKFCTTGNFVLETVSSLNFSLSRTHSSGSLKSYNISTFNLQVIVVLYLQIHILKYIEQLLSYYLLKKLKINVNRFTLCKIYINLHCIYQF
jgi:hypothetical protein